MARHSEIDHGPQPLPEHRFFSGKHLCDTYPTVRELKDLSPLPIFAKVDLEKPDSIEALYQLVNEWEDQDPYWVLRNGDRVPLRSITSSSPVGEISKIVRREVHLYSYGNRVAIATFKPDAVSTLRVVADQNKLPTNQDENMNFFNELITEKRAWVAGNNERNTEKQTVRSVDSTQPTENTLEVIAAGDD